MSGDDGGSGRRARTGWLDSLPPRYIHGMIRYATATPAHIGRIATRMGEWDRIECAAGGHAPKDALRLSLRGSIMAWTALIDGRPVAMWGLTAMNLMDGEGSPWMLGTDEARLHPKAFYVGGARSIPMMLRACPRLVNSVACGNKAAIRLLTRWGFVVGGEIETRRGVDFVPFRMGE